VASATLFLSGNGQRTARKKWSAGRMIGHPVNQPSLAIISALPALEYIPYKWFQLTAGVQVSLFGKNTLHSYSPTLALFFNF
jgi:hypothetical protein